MLFELFIKKLPFCQIPPKFSLELLELYLENQVKTMTIGVWNLEGIDGFRSDLSIA